MGPKEMEKNFEDTFAQNWTNSASSLCAGSGAEGWCKPGRCVGGNHRLNIHVAVGLCIEVISRPEKWTRG